MIKESKYQLRFFVTLNGAGEGIRTLDIHLGKVVLYQLSYARIFNLTSLYITNLASIGKCNLKFD